MKKLLVFVLLLVLGSFAFAEGFSGETAVETGYDLDDKAITYEVDAGIIYNIGWFTVGLDAFTDTFKDLDLGLPLTGVFGPFTVKVEPGLDNLFQEEVFGVDTDLTFTAGILSTTVGFGYGTDSILDITGLITLTPVPWFKAQLEYLDGTDILTKTAVGDFELRAIFTY